MKPAQTMEITSDWWPGLPVWEGTVADDAGLSAGAHHPKRRDAVVPRHAGTGLSSTPSAKLSSPALMPVKAAADMSKYLLCPMPGLVKAIHVVEGQDVKAGDSLAMVEAMKMENILKAERDGKVKKVSAKAGDSLAVDAVILEFA